MNSKLHQLVYFDEFYCEFNKQMKLLQEASELKAAQAPTTPAQQKS